MGNGESGMLTHDPLLGSRFPIPVSRFYYSPTLICFIMPCARCGFPDFSSGSKQ